MSRKTYASTDVTSYIVVFSESHLAPALLPTGSVAMSVWRQLFRWNLFFRTRRRTLRLLLLSCSAVCSLLVLTLLDLPDRHSAISGPSETESGALRHTVTCPRTTRSTADLDLPEVFPTLNFTVSWCGETLVNIDLMRT